jgi:hypothetical protein
MDDVDFAGEFFEKVGVRIEDVRGDEAGFELFLSRKRS